MAKIFEQRYVIDYSKYLFLVPRRTTQTGETFQSRQQRPVQVNAGHFLRKMVSVCVAWHFQFNGYPKEYQCNSVYSDKLPLLVQIFHLAGLGLAITTGNLGAVWKKFRENLNGGAAIYEANPKPIDSLIHS